MKYKPSKNFLISAGFLILSFFTMQGIVVPDLAREHFSAQVVSFYVSEMISRAQTRLAELDFYNGQINGRLTVNTKSGLKKFQKQNNLKQTGILDAETQKLLLGIDLYRKNNPNIASGKLRKLAWEEFDEKSKTIRETYVSYYIEKSDGKMTKLNPKSKIDEMLLNRPVDYDLLTQRLTLSANPDILKPVADKKDRDGEKENPTKKVLVLLSEFSNSTANITPAENYEEYLFGENGYIRKFYIEMTHGQVELEADVKGWYSFDFPGTSYTRPPTLPNYCGLSNDQIIYIANHYEVDVYDYDIVVSISNCEEYNTLGGVTFQQFGLPGIPTILVLGHHDRLDVSEMENYIDWPGLAWNLVHEIGHGLGLHAHSNTLDCNEEILWNNCLNVEYGNMFDAMGHWDGRIFNFLRQKEVGWIEDENILQISGPGNYHIDNLQTQGGVVGAVISVSGNPLYAVEHRAPEGFDSYIESEVYDKARNGLLLYAYINTRWRLIDPHPTNFDIFEDIKYDGIYSYQPFYDTNFGISIDVTNVTDTGVDFYVDYYDPLYIIPSAPTNLTMQAVPPNILCWQDNSISETGFYIERRIGSSSSSSFNPYNVGIDVNCKSFGTLPTGSTYYFKVKAKGIPFDSAFSESFEFIN